MSMEQYTIDIFRSVRRVIIDDYLEDRKLVNELDKVFGEGAMNNLLKYVEYISLKGS